MQFTELALFLSALSPLITTVSASATRFPANHPLHRRGMPGAVYICDDQKFEGNCGWHESSDKCRVPGGGNLGPESIGPDKDGYCTLYSSNDCSGVAVTTLRYPGLPGGLPEFHSLKCSADQGKSTPTD